ncbi:MAG: helix-turn-helix domain-containing protein [Bacilli bacterium]|nr:helix-turn-helix domain-containing protein [Bacilli bacterium]
MTIEIANRLLELRKKSGLSQEELADKLGVSRQAVSKWERAESSPDTDNLICLSKIYGVSLDEILDTNASVEDIAEDKRMEKEGKGERETLVGEVVDEDDDEKDDDEEYDGQDRGRSSWVSMAWMSPLAVIAYILVAIFWVTPDGGRVGAASGWVLLLLPVVINSLLSAIRSKNPSHFAFPVLVVIAYCGAGIIGNYYGLQLWHPYWVEWLLIPLYYTVADSIRRSRRAK